jgi:IS5 family transposase
LAKAAEPTLLRTTRLRADTTVVPADVAYPTDSGLLAKAVRRIAATGRRVQAAGGATRTRVRGRGPGRSGRSCGCARRRAATRPGATVRRVTGQLAELAERAAADAEKLLVNAHRALRRVHRAAAERQASGRPDAGRRRGRLRGAVDDLTELLAATRRIAAQTRQPLSGTTPDGATRRLSLHDGDARPIAKGRLGRPVEFGYKAQVVDNDDDRPRMHRRARPHRRTRQPRRRTATRPPPSPGSLPGPGAARAPSPPTAATAARSRTTCMSSACAPS